MKTTTILCIIAIIVGIVLFCVGIANAEWRQKSPFEYTYYTDLNKPIAIVYMNEDKCWCWEVGINNFRGEHYSGGDETTTMLDAVNEVERILSYYYYS